MGIILMLYFKQSFYFYVHNASQEIFILFRRNVMFFKPLLLYEKFIFDKLISQQLVKSF